VFAPPAAWFGRWWSAREFLKAVQHHADPVPAHILFNQPSLLKLLEAHAAARFAVIRSKVKPIKIRLEADRFPDFQLDANGTIEPFELVEADRDGRRRGKEYIEAATRQAGGMPPLAELVDPVEEEQEAFEAIDRVLSKKASKRYAPAPNILVYVNFMAFEELPLTYLHAAQLIDAHQQQFPSAWLLWGDTAARLWQRPAKIVDRSGMAR